MNSLYKQLLIFKVSFLLGIITFAQQEPNIVLPLGHTEDIICAEFSPNGKYVATSSFDNTIKIWEANTGKLVFNLTEYIYTEYMVGWFPNSQKFYSISGDSITNVYSIKSGNILCRLYGHLTLLLPNNNIVTAHLNNIKLWDTETGHNIKTLTGHKDSILSLVHVSDNKIVSTSADGTCKIWNFENGELLHTFNIYYPNYNLSSLSPDGNYILLPAKKNTVAIFEIFKEDKKFTIKIDEKIRSAKWSPDGQVLATRSGCNKVQLWDALTGNLIHDIAGINTAGHVSGVMNINFSNDGSKLIVSSRDIGRIWDVNTGKLLLALTPKNGYVLYSDFLFEDSMVYTVLTDSTVKIWNTNDGANIHNFDGHSEWVSIVRLSPDKNRLLTCGGDRLKIWNLTSGNLETELKGLSHFISRAGWNPDLSIVYTSCSDNTIKQWDFVKGTRTNSFIGHSEEVTSVIWSPDRQKLLTGSIDNTAKIWNPNTGKILLTLEHDQNWVHSAYWSPDGSKILTASGSTIQIWDSETGNLLIKIEDPDYYTIYEAKWSPNGEKFATASEDNKASIWISENGKLKKNLIKHNQEVISVIWSHDGNKILTISSDFTVKAWDAKSGKLLGNIKVGNYIHSVCWSPDSKYIATAAYNKLVQIWDAETFELYKTLIGHQNSVNLLHWLPDGKKIISSSSDKTVIIWDIETGEIIKSIDLDKFICRDINLENNMIISSFSGKTKVTNINTGEEIMQLIAIDSTDYFFITPDNFYKSSKDALKWLSFRIDNTLYGFEQFDLKYNRPDIVLQRLGYASQHLIESYHKAYLKRLKKMGFKEEDLEEDFHVPETEIIDFEYMPIIEQDTISLDLKFNDSKYNLDRYNIWINDVALFGMRGKSLKSLKTNSFRINGQIKLSKGSNKIQVSCLNEKGAESYKETVELRYEPKSKTKHDLYVLSISVSDYLQSTFNLKYAVKDGRDLVNLFPHSQTHTYDNIYIDTLFNSDVTLENVKALKQKLLKTNVDDQVILYVSGHGLLDDNLDFYFASHNMDFDDLAKYGISYDVLEDLLDSIPARKKLFLMDACHSGEVDKDEVEAVTDTTIFLADGTKSGLKTYSYKGAKTKTSGGVEGKLGLQNSFELMKELFTNLNRGSGAQVISAAAGDSYALESQEWNNGVFTYAILNGLKNKAADKDGDGEVSVSELREYVVDEVQKLTNGRQKPTSRQENVEFDFRVW
jgi:WD40 repeat protein